MERGKTRKRPPPWWARWLLRPLRAAAAGVAGTVGANNVRVSLIVAACYLPLAWAPMPDGSRPFAVAAFAAQLSSPWGVPAAFAGCALGALMGWNGSWFQWWQVPACAALWLSYPLWRGPQRGFPVRAALAACLAMLLPMPLIAGASPIDRLQCLLSAAVAGSMTLVFHQLQSALQRPPRPLRNDERLCALLGLGVLVLGGSPWSPLGCNLGVALAICFSLLLAQGCGANAGMLTGAALGLALVAGGGEPWLAAALGAGGALAGALGGERRGTACALFALGALVGAVVLQAEARWPPVGSLALGSLLYLLMPEKLRKAALCYAAPAYGEGAMRLGAVGAAFAHTLESRARGLRSMASALPKPVELPMELPHRLKRLAALHCEGCERAGRCWHSGYAETEQVLGSLIEIAEEREVDPADVIGTASVIGCARGLRLPGALAELLREEAKLLARQARQGEARAIAGTQFEGFAQCMEGIALAMREETVFLPMVRRRVQRALGRAGVEAEVLTAARVGGRTEVLLAGRDAGWLREAGALVSRAAGLPMAARPDDAGERPEVLFEQEPALAVEVGMALRAKHAEAVAGDGQMVQRLPRGLQLLALSDGMGSGPRASRESRATLLLLRQCLVAGYTRAQALVAVNELLLSCGGEDMFATMDLCLLDLHTGEAAFEKLGACTSYVVRGQSCRPIAGETLPLGILTGVRPRSCRMRLREGDLVVMLSDGVADAYPGGEESVIRVLAKLHALPAQSIADALLQRALAVQSDRPRDDMTALCARLQTAAPRP
ncbi:MAG: SpoIIE family protein phosphatase [Clostridia bacterium]|nr:SpoIIE family protein phosphatase [Clostridia bacterium]